MDKAKIKAALVSHTGERCGVHQFGTRLFEAVQGSEEIAWRYVECDGPDDLIALAADVDLILVNHVESTMPWLAETLPRVQGPMLMAVRHETHYQAVEHAATSPYALQLCPDPTLVSIDPRVVGLPRFTPEPLQDLPPAPDIFTVGSFGFATPGKGFEDLCELVNAQFDRARIRINIPPHDNEAFVPAQAAEDIFAGCRKAVTKPGIILDCTRTFMSEPELLQFLAENTINAFAYNKPGAEGISSAVDYALAAGRPVAVSRSPMFRHVHAANPSILLEERGLQSIADHGFAPLERLRERFSQKEAGARWNEAVLRAWRQRQLSLATPDGRGFNKILDDRSRDGYQGVIDELFRLAPDLIARKIPRANIQQAFCYDTAKRYAPDFPTPRILAIGSYEDTTMAALAAEGYRYDEIDPNVNGLDLKAFYRLPTTKLAYYDLIICVSVLEHVEEDEHFVSMVSDLLAPGGVGVFTVDFSENYPKTHKKPSIDHRLYTASDISERLMRRARDCVLVDAPNWLDGQDEFEHIGCWYSFASWVFRKRTAAEMAATPRSAPPLWPEIMEVCVQRPLGVESSGFYPTEDHGEDGRRLRWTGAVGEISVALNPASLPRFLELKLWPITSAKGTPFRLLVNGVELLNSRVVVVPVDTVVALPNLAGMQEIHIRLEAETFEAGEGSTRRLGLAVESIALLARKQEPPPWPERLEVGVSTPPFAADSGLWAPELRSGRPLRWTKGVAEIAVDLNAETLPRFLAFKLWEITPPTGTSYRLTVDGHEVATGRIEGKPVARIVRLPDLAGRETVRIVLESPTFVTPGYEDRPMGVAVESIALLARRPDSKAWPARLEIGVDQPPFAVSSGLYPAEAHEGRPLRWTTDVSEFTVDLNPKSLPRGLQLKLWEIAPPEGAFYRVLVNGHEAMIGRVLGAPVTRSVGLPDLTGCDEIHIRLESSTFTPPGGAPDRPLGVALESLALLAKEPLAMPWPEQLEVGAEQPMFAHATGLFALEKNEGRPLRWTGGLVRVVVDINPSTPPRSLLLRLWAIAPPKGTSYKLAVNGKRLLSGVVTSRPVQDLAALPDLSGERQLVIELECDTFRGSAADTRDLGVALESIALLQSEPKFVALP